MHLHDRIYGNITIDSPIILALLETDALKRLDHILQHGISSLIGLSRKTTRLEHSIGTMIAVTRLGATEEEQIAALLHDVSHTAFSHVMDHVFGDALSQSYHDVHQEAYVVKTDIPAVLDSFGKDWRVYLDETAFPLLEQPSPALCGDRIDYSLRDIQDFGFMTRDQIDAFLSDLIVHDGRIACQTPDIAEQFGRAFIACDDASWSNFREVGLYELTAKALRRGFKIGLLDDSDIWSIDQLVWKKLGDSDDAEIQELVSLITLDTEFVWDDDNPDFAVRTKIRAIDPDVLTNGKLIPLSQIRPNFGQFRDEYINRKSNLWKMSVKRIDSGNLNLVQ